MATAMQWFGDHKVVCHELVLPGPAASQRQCFLEASVTCLVLCPPVGRLLSLTYNGISPNVLVNKTGRPLEVSANTVPQMAQALPKD